MFDQMLAQLNLTDNKIFGLEAGLVAPSGSCPPNVPDCPVFEAQAMLNFIQEVLPIWASVPNFITATILSYNPELADKSPWVWGSLFEQFIKSLQDPTATAIQGIEKILQQFLDWLNNHNLVDCPNGGMAISLDYCTAANRIVPSANNCPTQNEGPFRPFAYSVCTVQKVPESVPSYATAFTASTKYKFHIDEVVDSKVCNNRYWPEYSWQADITENYTKPRLPWAGYGESTNSDLAESEYLADYYEGTAYYNGERPKWEDVWNQAGVFRKLAPDWYQDDLKCEMIKNSDENYEVKLEILGGDLSILGNLASLPINWFAERTGPNKDKLRDITCPPKDPTERTAWKTANWRDALLWAAVPMFTRADSPGLLTLTSQYPSNLSDTTGDGENINSNKINYPLSVPHLKRLRDISNETYSMLLPDSFSSANNRNTAEISPETKFSPASQNAQSSISNIKYLASSQPLSPPSNLLAEAPQPPPTSSCPNPGLNLYQNINPDGSVSYSFTETLINNCYYNDITVHVEYFLDGNSIGECSEFFRQVAHNDPNDPNNHPLPLACQPAYNISQGGQLTAKIWWEGAGIQGGDQTYCGNPTAQTDSCQCTTTTDQSGQATTNCLVNTPKSEFTCNPKGRTASSKEDPSAQTDPKDPDKLDKLRDTPTKQLLDNPDDWPTSGALVKNADQDQIRCYQGETNKCFRTRTFATQITSTLQFPHLIKIWDNIAKTKNSGLMNLFTTGETGFRTADSKTNIDYATTTPNVQIKPTEGSVYVPFLQGIAEAQACVSRRLLLPEAFRDNISCPPIFNTF